MYKAELIIEVLDARAIEDSRNKEIEQKVKQSGKKLLFVINKCDLVEKGKLEEAAKELKPSIFISSTEHLGTTLLKKKILEISHGEPIVVGIMGYPNVGKSSLINALAGRGAAGTSPESGFTKGMQKIRVGTKIMLLDTPGVFSRKEKKEDYTYARFGAIDYGKIKDPENIALQLIDEEKAYFEERYGISAEDAEEFLDKYARKKNLILSGGRINAEAAARRLLKEWQEKKGR